MTDIGIRAWICTGGRNLLATVLLSAGVAGCTGSSSESSDAADPVGTAALSTPATGGSATGGAAPTISLSAPATVDQGDSATLTWSADNADDCNASGGWSGTRATSGSQSSGPLTIGTTFSLTCNGPGGSAIQMISVAVIGPVQLAWVAPEENVDGSPLVDLAGYRIYYGETSRDYSGMVELADETTTSHTLTLASGDYYVAMTALDADGNESGYSNEVIKTRP